MLYMIQVDFGRARTSAESTAINNYLTTNSADWIIVKSTTYNVPDTEVSFTDTLVYAWGSQAGVDGYVALVNGFTPAPESVQVLG
jgi:hypothetical protein